MNLICQKQAVEQLQEAAKSKCQSILLSGPSGCGKTYLAKMYSKLLDVPDFLIQQKSGKEVTKVHVPDSRENESPRYDTGAAHI